MRKKYDDDDDCIRRELQSDLFILKSSKQERVMILSPQTRIQNTPNDHHIHNVTHTLSIIVRLG